MESVINKLAEIETAATKIMQAAENQKKLQDEQQEERIAKSMQIWKRKRQSGLKRSQQTSFYYRCGSEKAAGLCRRTSIFTGRLLRTESRNTVHTDLRKHYKEVKR